jgi:hypothetical protein
MYIGPHWTYLLIWSDFITLDFFYRISKNIQIQNLMKIRLMGVEFFQADGLTDRQADIAKLIVERT